jgi:hypothetical protein
MRVNDAKRAFLRYDICNSFVHEQADSGKTLHFPAVRQSGKKNTPGMRIGVGKSRRYSKARAPVRLTACRRCPGFSGKMGRFRWDPTGSEKSENYWRSDGQLNRLK